MGGGEPLCEAEPRGRQRGQEGGCVAALWPPKAEEGGCIQGLPKGPSGGAAFPPGIFPELGMGTDREVRPILDPVAMPTPWPGSQGAREGAYSESLELCLSPALWRVSRVAVCSHLGFFPQTEPRIAWRGWTAPPPSISLSCSVSLCLILSLTVSFHLSVSRCPSVSFCLSAPDSDSKGQPLELEEEGDGAWGAHV